MAEFLIERSHEAEDETIDEATRQQLIARDRERLRQMTFYCTTTECLRHYILRYFGENSPLSCGHCSSCDTNFEEVDATMSTEKFSRAYTGWMNAAVRSAKPSFRPF